MLNMSGLRDTIDQATQHSLGVYADAGYFNANEGISLIVPYKGCAVTADQQHFNSTMAQYRITIEWAFGLVTRLWNYLNSHTALQSLRQPLGCYYKVAVLLTNCFVCLYGSQVGDRFAGCVPPPLLDDYLAHPTAVSWDAFYEEQERAARRRRAGH